MKAAANTVGIMAPPMKPCSARQTIISLDRGGGGAHDAHQREAAGRDREEIARRERPAEEAGKRDHDDLGDEVGGLHPGDLVGARRQPGLDLGERRGDDLDVEDRHEHADRDRHEGGDQLAGDDGLRRRRWARPLSASPSRKRRNPRRMPCVAAPRLSAPRRSSAPVRVSTSATTDMPGRIRPSAADVGRQADAHGHALHDLGEVAGGVVGRQQAEHRAGRRRDALDRALDRRGRDRRRPRSWTVWPGCTSASCVSLKFASM